MTTNNIIQGWTPKTEFLLRSAHHNGYDIIDHAFGSTFPSRLLNELQVNGWVDDPDRNISGKMQPALTKMDADM